MALSPHAKEILNDAKRVATRETWFERMQNVFNGTENGQNVLAVNGIVGRSPIDPYTEPEKWVYGCLENLAENAEALDDPVMFKPLCVEYGIFGVHFIDRILGARVYFQDGQWYNDYLRSEIGKLPYPDLEHDETWALARRAALAFTEADQKLALFGLPTIASVLNIAVNLYGENILAEMILEPENVKKDFQTINRLLIELHTWYRQYIPQQLLQPVISWNRTQPPGYGQLCGCTTHLISKDTYAEFVAPLDDALLGVYPNGGMIHLCGSHLQHLETFRNMKNLKAVQLNDRAAHDLREYYYGLREDQVIYLNPCEGMTVEKAMEITGGHRLVIADNIDKAIHHR